MSRLLHNMSVAPRTTVKTQSCSIASVIALFGLPQAVALSGLLEDDGPFVSANWPCWEFPCLYHRYGPWHKRVGTYIRARWKTPANLMEFLDWDEGNEPRLPLHFVIGWDLGSGDPAPGAGEDFCEDIALVLSVLSRRIGSLYLGSRPPSLTWATLLAAPFAIDDPAVCRVAFPAQQ